MKILYNTGSEFKESKESAENLSVKIMDDNGNVIEKTVQELVSDNFYGIERLIGTEDVNDDHRSIREITRNELAKQLVPEDAKESLDTLQEIADWIQDHPDDAAQMNSRIGTLEEAVPFVLYIQNGVYGYKKENGDFIPFKSQADIDAAVTAAKVGTATAADVLAGKTFTNADTSGVTGTMVDHDAATNAVSVGTNNANTYHRIPTGAYLKLQGTGYPEIVTPLTEYGDAAAGDVLSGKKFTSSAGLKATGTMPSRSLGTAATGSGIDGTGPYVYMPYGWWPEYSGKAGSSYTYMTAAQAVAACPKQEKSCTPSTSAQTISPDSGKLLSKVSVAAIPTQRGTSGQAPGNKCWTYNNRVYFGIDYGWYPSGSSFGSMSNVCERYVDYANVASAVGLTAGKLLSGQSCLGISGTGATPTQEKTITASRSAQTVTPDSGKHLSKVTVNKYPDASGTYTPSTHGTALDMGTTNNYRYVNTTNAYNKGSNDRRDNLSANWQSSSGDASISGTTAYKTFGSLSVNNLYCAVLHMRSNSTNRIADSDITVSSGGTKKMAINSYVHSWFGGDSKDQSSAIFFKATSTQVKISITNCVKCNMDLVHIF